MITEGCRSLPLQQNAEHSILEPGAVGDPAAVTPPARVAAGQQLIQICVGLHESSAASRRTTDSVTEAAPGVLVDERLVSDPLFTEAIVDGRFVGRDCHTQFGDRREDAIGRL